MTSKYKFAACRNIAAISKACLPEYSELYFKAMVLVEKRA